MTKRFHPTHDVTDYAPVQNGLSPCKMAPATWWATYGKHLPLLSYVARRMLSQPCCASAAERNWSVYGQIKTAARSRMGHAVGDQLVYCHERRGAQPQAAA